MKTASLILVLLISVISLAQSDSAKYKEIKGLAWLEGTYRGEKWGNYIEEIWSSPRGNNLTGMFRMMNGDEIVFTELIYIDEINGSTAMRLKHFDKMFAGWEEADKTVNFPFISQTERKVVFDGIVYDASIPGKLKVTVRMQNKNGEVSEEEFLFDKVK